MNVYIVRHGQVPHNALGQYNSNDEDLTILGVQQAENLRKQIDSIKFDVIICSPLKRAKHTADIINVNNQKIIYDERIKEVMHCQKLIWQISFSFHKFNNFFLLCLISYNVRLPVICVACVYITGNNFTGLIR